MEQPQFIKCEPDWLSDSGESYNCELNEEAATDKLEEVKCEPADKYSDPNVGNCTEEFIKEEEEFQDVKEGAQDDACIVDGSPSCWIQPLSTGVVEEEMSNSDERHLKEINGSNHAESDSSIVGLVAPVLPDEGRNGESQISGNTSSTETFLNTQESSSFVSSANRSMFEKKCTHLFESIGKNLYCCKMCNYCAYPCSMCDKYFINRSSMYRHQLKHSQDNWLCCNYCGKAFNDRSNLGRHMLSHEENKAHECTVCGKAFSLRFQLKNHMIIHNRDTPFVCQICNEGFSRRSALNSHILTHSGVESFKCTKCDRAFGRNSSLQKHLLAHTKEPMPCTCTVCGKSFSKQKYLKAHMPVHEQTDSFPCDECGKSFNNKSYLKRHILRHTAKVSS